MSDTEPVKIPVIAWCKVCKMEVDILIIQEPKTGLRKYSFNDVSCPECHNVNCLSSTKHF